MPPKNTHPNMANIVEAATKLMVAKRPNVTESTIKTYESRLKVLVNGLKANDIKAMLNNVAAVDAYIKNKKASIATNTTTYTSLVRYADALDLPTAVREHYDKMMMESSEKGKDIAKQNRPKPKIQKATGGKSTLDLADLQEKVRALSTYDQKHLVLAMCILMPSRRLEIRSLIYYDKAPTQHEPTDVKPPTRPTEERKDTSGTAWNYIYPIAADKYRMVLRFHKERDVQGVFAVDLNDEVSGIFSKYIKEEGLEHGDDVFFKPTAQSVYSSAAFSDFVSSALKKLTGIDGLRMDDLRHAWSTSVREGNTTTYANKESLAKAMGHSVTTADIVYNKVVADADVGAGPSSPSVSGSVSDANLLKEVRAMMKRLREIEKILANKEK